MEIAINWTQLIEVGELQVNAQLSDAVRVDLALEKGHCVEVVLVCEYQLQREALDWLIAVLPEGIHQLRCNVHIEGEEWPSLGEAYAFEQLLV